MAPFQIVNGFQPYTSLEGGVAHGRKGDVIELDDEQAERLVALGAVVEYDPDAPTVDPAGSAPAPLDLDTADTVTVARFILDTKPSIKELVALVESGDEDGVQDRAQRVLDAEDSATEGHPRAGLVKALTALGAQ